MVVILFPIFSYCQSEEIGKRFISSLLVEKDWVKAYSFFDESVKAKLSEHILSATVLQLDSQLGKFIQVTSVTRQGESYYFYSEFEKSKLDIQITLSPANKLLGFFIVPHKESTAKTMGIEYPIKSNGVELKGTLLVPTLNNKKKIIVFIHGSGPNDRDETVFENKPFKDIAESVYLSGISSYRYDKRTLLYPTSFTDESTLNDEVIDDAVNVIQYLKNDPQFSGYANCAWS